jgi:hypothetical protein
MANSMKERKAGVLETDFYGLKDKYTVIRH